MFVSVILLSIHDTHHHCGQFFLALIFNSADKSYCSRDFSEANLNHNDMMFFLTMLSFQVLEEIWKPSEDGSIFDHPEHY